MTIYLYVKTHNITGLKYLGFTKRDPFTYFGSGVRWKAHINKHGKAITTTILLKTEDVNQIRETGLFFSKLWNVVESTEWANLKPEDANSILYIPSIQTRQPHSKETKQKISDANRGERNGMFGRKHPKTTEAIQKLKNTLATSENMRKRNSSHQWRANVSAAQSIPVRLISAKTGVVIRVFRNSQHAAEVLGCNRTNINAAIRNNRPIGKKLKSLSEECYVEREVNAR